MSVGCGCTLRSSSRLTALKLQTPETQGMIPRAIAKIFDSTDRLKAQGWVYELEGQFLEIVSLISRPLTSDERLSDLCPPQYNETINDLLGSSDFDKKKHEIKHEKVGRFTRTTVSDATVGEFDPPTHS